MISLDLKRAATLALLAFVPAAYAPMSGGGSVTPSAGSRALEAKGVGALPPAGGGGGGGGAVVPPNVCQPLPGTCVLTATMVGFGNTNVGQIRFERSPSRMAVTSTIRLTGPLKPPAPFVFDRFAAHLNYQGVLVNPSIATGPGIGAPGAWKGLAARGLFDAGSNLVLETLPGDGLFSQTPSFLPEDPAILAFRIAFLGTLVTTGQIVPSALPALVAVAQAASPTYPVDLTPPDAAVLAAFESAQVGSSVDLITMVPGIGLNAGQQNINGTPIWARGVFQ